MCCTSYRKAVSQASIPLLNRWFLTVLALVSLASAALVPANAQTAVPPGIVRGKIQNATNGAYLENATVIIAGTNHKTTTNNYGEYEFRDVPAGEITLVAKYVGEPDLKAAVTVIGGSSVERDFTFRETAETIRTKDGAIVLDPFQVRSERYKNASAVAIAVERSSVNIKNVVATDAFGDIPNGNVGEFVKFLPGVQIDYGASNGNNQGYSDSDASGVSVRGFGPEDTTILIDGLPVASTNPGNLTRQIGLDQLSINNASRVELIKVATPDMPNNSMGGQINLITKSAFEFSKADYSARVFFNFNSLNRDFSKSPGPVNKHTYKTTPGLDFTVTVPLTKTLGVSFTGFSATEFGQSYRAQPVWNNTQAAAYQNGSYINASGQASSISNPILTRYQITDSPRLTDKRSGNLKVDWKPTSSQLIRANIQYSTYETAEAQRRLDLRPYLNTGANIGADWSSTKVEGVSVGTASNTNGVAAMTVTTRDRVGDTISAQLQYTLNWGGWSVYAAGSISDSKSDFKDADNGHYSEVNFNLNPGKLGLYNLRDGIVGYAVAYAKTTNVLLDYTQFKNWAFDGTTAKSGESHNENRKTLYKLDVERDLSFLPFIGANSLSVKVGVRQDEDINSKSGRGTGYREILRPGASYTVADILDTSYMGQSPGFGLPAQEWGSTYKLYEVNKAKDLFYVPDFDESTNTRVENYNSAVGQLKSINEKTLGWYGQFSGSFLKNRLSFIGGMRQEEKSRKGYSPFTDSKWNYVKNKDGSLYTNTANPNGLQTDVGNGSVLNGVLITNPTNRPLYATDATGIALRQSLTAAGILFPAVPYGPTSGANASLVSRMLQFQPARSVNSKAKGDPSFSFSTAFKLTEKIDLKASWSRAFGLPKLEDAEFGVVSGTSNFSINDFTSTEEGSNGGYLGEIKIANPNIKPTISDGWDFEVSYYTSSGGKLSADFFYKTVTNQPVTLVTYSGTPTFDEILPILGLDPTQYNPWRLATSTNATNEQISQGVEVEVRQDFSFLGGWGKNFSGFVTGSYTKLGEPPVVPAIVLQNPNGTTTTFPATLRSITARAKKSGGAGLMFSNRRFTAQLRASYKEALNVGSYSTANGNLISRYVPSTTTVDVNLGYTISKRYSLFVSARDILNGDRSEKLKDANGLLPSYASLNDYKEFGTVWTVGITGKF